VVEWSRRYAVRPVARVLPTTVTPNRLSGLRLVLVGILAGLLWRGEFLFAVWTYAGALVTDALDGEVARLRDARTRFGARLDPSVDKVLHGVLFLYFWSEAPVLLGLLLLLDLGLFLIGLALVLRSRALSRDLSASVFGRWKMIFQALACAALLWNVLAPSLPFPRPTVVALLSLALAFAFLSMAGYIQRFRAREKSPSL
jgi:CDP-diacylglycerol--glycerol-3-phosphate 3-phosphatidyltransferase